MAARAARSAVLQPCAPAGVSRGGCSVSSARASGSTLGVRRAGRKSLQRWVRNNGAPLLMSLPCILHLFIFAYLPMFGIIIAFKRYRFDQGIFGSEWIGLYNFRFLLSQAIADRWSREGLPAGVSPRDYFGVNEIVRLAGDHSMQFPERVVTERGLVREYWDKDGALRRDLHTEDGWTSQWVDFTIKTREDWAKRRHRMVYDPGRVPEGTRDAYARARAEGKFASYTAHACFHPTWMRIGILAWRGCSFSCSTTPTGSSTSMLPMPSS